MGFGVSETVTIVAMPEPGPAMSCVYAQLGKLLSGLHLLKECSAGHRGLDQRG